MKYIKVKDKIEVTRPIRAGSFYLSKSISHSYGTNCSFFVLELSTTAARWADFRSQGAIDLLMVPLGLSFFYLGHL